MYEYVGHATGHPLHYSERREAWYYDDTNEVFDAKSPTPRACSFCHKPPVRVDSCCGIWADACLGVLPGVKAACCGHGIAPGYIYYDDEEGTTVPLPRLKQPPA